MGKWSLSNEKLQTGQHFFIIKFFKLRDKTGEIIVVTKGRTLPEIKSQVRVKGSIDQTFSIGDQKLVVFVQNQLM